MPSEEVPGDTTDRVLGATAAAEPPAWDLAAEAVEVSRAEAVAVGGAGKRLDREEDGNHRSTI